MDVDLLVEGLRWLARASLVLSGVALLAALAEVRSVTRAARVLWTKPTPIADLPAEARWVVVRGRVRAVDAVIPALTDGRDTVVRHAPDRVVSGTQRWETATVPFVVHDGTGAVSVEPESVDVLSPLVVWGSIADKRAHERLLLPGDEVTVGGRIAAGRTLGGGWLVRDHRSLATTSELRWMGTAMGFALVAAIVALGLALLGIRLGFQA